MQGDARSIARALSLVENGADHEITELLKELFPHTGRSFVVGITGSPGAGKSTLVDQLARAYRDAGKKIGIIAVDPSSAFSGGAILGDRIRMQSISTDPKVFIRSMATRGQMGGLSAAAGEALLVLDAAGFEILLVETVGVGQDEIDIVRTADVTVVVLVPGMGDEIQTIKAGIMEIGDVFVINKADRDGAIRMEHELEALFATSRRKDGWKPPVVQTEAIKGHGIAELIASLNEYRVFQEEPQRRKNRQLEFFQDRLREILRERITRFVAGRISNEELKKNAEEIVNRRLDPYTIADRLWKKTSVEEDRE